MNCIKLSFASVSTLGLILNTVWDQNFLSLFKIVTFPQNFQCMLNWGKTGDG